MFVLYSHRIAAVHKIIQFFWRKKGDSVRDKIACFRLRLLSDAYWNWKIRTDDHRTIDVRN